ncbi:hypothetical protein QBC38DRAFT_87556 [Podospora fimiseda]|uniref:Dihydrodipicolinate synthase n=1 Tax=Podospora fimiseda TaxID=252190 RepID=A0AAN6YN59_9PEZI|nr:hypothetical protein QBC38DRAFT_87556 [Podospora fimiseda]
MGCHVPPRGVWVPVPTLFYDPSDRILTASDQSAVNLKHQAAHAVQLAKDGITGLVLLGSSGEAVHLSRSERIDVIKAVRKGLDDAGFPDYPIMAGVLTNGIDETIQQLQDFASAGAQWGLVLVPGYFGGGVSQEGIMQYFSILAERNVMPLLVYNYPGVTNGITVLPETYRRLAAIDGIVGCKMSHGNVSHHIQVSLDPEIDRNGFRVFSGFGQQLGPIVLFGAAGVIDGLSAFYPKTVVRLFNVLDNGPHDEKAKEQIATLQYVVSRAEEFIVRYGIAAIKEGVFRVKGFGTCVGVRPPLVGRLKEEDWQQAREEFLLGIEAFEKSI